MKTRLLSLVVLLCMSLGTAHGMIKGDALKVLTASKEKMMANVAMLEYYCHQIAVKHEHNLLLNTTAEVNGIEYFVDALAEIYMPEEHEDDLDKMFVHPKENVYLAPIIDGIFKAHPELKIKLLRRIDGNSEPEQYEYERFEGRIFIIENIEEVLSRSEEEMKNDNSHYYIRLTMPPVTGQLRKTYHEIVENFYKGTKMKLDAERVKMKANVTPKTIGYTDKDLKEVDAKMDEIYNEALIKAQNIRKDKDEEIEWGYNRFVEIYGDDYEEDYDTPDNSEEIIIENVVIEDGKVFYTTEDVIALNLTFKRNFTKDALCAFSVPFSFKASDVAGKFYDFGNYNEKDSTLTLVPHDGAIEAGKGYFFLPEEDITQMVFENALVIATPTPPLPIETGIYGALTGLSFLEESYVLQTAANGASKLTKAQKDTRLAPYQSYLWISDMPDASEITIRLSDEALNVDGLKATPSKAASLIYNLRGQRIATPSRGELYIKNGKKYMMR